MCGVSTDKGRLDWVQQLRGIRSNQKLELERDLVDLPLYWKGTYVSGQVATEVP